MLGFMNDEAEAERLRQRRYRRFALAVSRQSRRQRRRVEWRKYYGEPLRHVKQRLHTDRQRLRRRLNAIALHALRDDEAAQTAADQLRAIKRPKTTTRQPMPLKPQLHQRLIRTIRRLRRRIPRRKS